MKMKLKLICAYNFVPVKILKIKWKIHKNKYSYLISILDEPLLSRFNSFSTYIYLTYEYEQTYFLHIHYV